ncbi:hypothetical protein GQX74_004869 [Glossina fuscipes]|nr:hypothetical protein GQX74_004869 [Glossina fuscipes]
MPPYLPHYKYSEKEKCSACRDILENLLGEALIKVSTSVSFCMDISVHTLLITTIKELIKDVQHIVKPEDSAYKAAINWVKYDLEKRKVPLAHESDTFTSCQHRVLDKPHCC